MGTVCIQVGFLAFIITAAITGGLILAALFVVIVRRIYLRNNKNGNKMFYVNRKQSIEADDTIDGDSFKKERPRSLCDDSALIQKSIELSGHSVYKEMNEQNNPIKLYELGITIGKALDSNFKVESVEKPDSQFLPGDILFHLALDLKQLPLEKASALLELLAPFKVNVEARRLKLTAISVEAEVEHDPIDESEEKKVKEVEIEDPAQKGDVTSQNEDGEDLEAQKKRGESESEQADEDIHEKMEKQVTEISPPPPASSPPASPVSGRSNRDSQASDSGRSVSDEESRRQATKIPTPKMTSRSLSRPVINRSPEDTENTSKMYQEIADGCRKDSDVLVVSSEETDEFGLTTTQYNTLENNRRRLERERQQLRDLGILS